MTTRSEDWPKVRYESGCGCGGRRRGSAALERLARESLSVALRHAQDSLELEDDFGLEAATPAGTITLPGRFSGWMHATPLATVLSGGGRSEFRDGRPRLYRIYEEKKQKPLYIGMAYRSSIRNRISRHLRALFTGTGAPTAAAASYASRTLTGVRSEIEMLRILAANTSMSGIKVQHGSVTPHPPHRVDAKLLHAFELALAYLERPHAYNPDIWSFEAG